jgi:hypothetical protein
VNEHVSQHLLSTNLVKPFPLPDCWIDETRRVPWCGVEWSEVEKKGEKMGEELF